MATVGTGKYTYDVVPNWGKLPSGWTFGEVSAVAVDSQDRLFVLQRGDPPILILDREGDFLSSWGNGTITFGHGIYIGPDDAIYLTDRNDHVALKFTLDGKPVVILGTRGQYSDTGCEEEAGTVLRAGGPFNMPSGMVNSPSGDLYVSDGYRNCRVHRFSSSGSLISSWGNPGKTAPGELHVPHCLWVDKQGLVYVCDRDNRRIQVFTATGEFKTMWTGLNRPTGIYMDANETVFVSELEERMSVLDKQGNVLARWDAPAWAHWLSGDSRGDLYLAEVTTKMITKYVKRQ